jgi:thiamine biosynthesis lipoprotein
VTARRPSTGSATAPPAGPGPAQHQPLAQQPLAQHERPPAQHQPPPARQHQPLVHVEHVMGTAVVLSVHGVADSPAVRDALAGACRVLHQADDVFSTWNPSSPMSRLRSGEASLDQLDPAAAAWIGEVLALCRRARTLTDGWFDPWALPGGVDPTGLVKGWAIERALAVLDARGLTAMVNGGGDIAWCGEPPDGGWRLGIRHPWVADGLACVAVGDRVRRAIATSAGYERGAHFVDPSTGAHTLGVLASGSVVGPDLALADALATALVVGGLPVLEAIRRMPAGGAAGYEAYAIGPGGEEWSTEGFPFAQA